MVGFFFSLISNRLSELEEGERAEIIASRTDKRQALNAIWTYGNVGFAPRNLVIDFARMVLRPKYASIVSDRQVDLVVPNGVKNIVIKMLTNSKSNAFLSSGTAKFLSLFNRAVYPIGTTVELPATVTRIIVKGKIPPCNKLMKRFHEWILGIHQHCKAIAPCIIISDYLAKGTSMKNFYFTVPKHTWYPVLRPRSFFEETLKHAYTCGCVGLWKGLNHQNSHVRSRYSKMLKDCEPTIVCHAVLTLIYRLWIITDEDGDELLLFDEAGDDDVANIRARFIKLLISTRPDASWCDPIPTLFDEYQDTILHYIDRKVKGTLPDCSMRKLARSLLPTLLEAGLDPKKPNSRGQIVETDKW